MTHDAADARKVPFYQRHFPQLDGLRGVAILMVLTAHFVYFQTTRDNFIGQAFDTVAQYGFLWVDLFFVLSGFLITGILYDTKENAHYFRNFYARRVLRIFPLYYTYIVVTCSALGAALWLRGYNALIVRALTDGAWASVYLTNLDVVLKGTKITFVFNHFWSLAIEEQFYLIWPLLVVFLTRRRLQFLCLLLVIVAAILRCGVPTGGWMLLHSPMLPARMDGLAMGAFIALTARNATGWKALVASAGYIFAAGLTALVLCVCAASPLVRGSLLFTTASLTFASGLVLAVAANSHPGIAAALGGRFLRTFGKYSYGIYVLNQPIAFFPGYAEFRQVLTKHLHSEFASAVVFAAGGIGLSFAAAWVSWQFLEQRFLKLKKYFSPTHALPPITGHALPAA